MGLQIIIKWLNSYHSGSVKYCPVECFDLILTSASGFLIGALYGGFPALRLGKKRYIDVSQGAAYETRFHAIVSVPVVYTLLALEHVKIKTWGVLKLFFW